MRFATAYKRHEDSISFQLSNHCGRRVATEPFTEIPADAPVEQLGKAVEEALERSQIGMASSSVLERD